MGYTHRSLQENVIWSHKLCVLFRHVLFRYLISGSRDNIIKIWNLSEATCVKTLLGHTDWVNRILILSENELISSSSDNTIRIWNLTLSKCIKILFSENHLFSSLLLLSSSLLASTSKDNLIKIFDLLSGKCVRRLNGHSNFYLCCQQAN